MKSERPNCVCRTLQDGRSTWRDITCKYTGTGAARPALREEEKEQAVLEAPA